MVQYYTLEQAAQILKTTPEKLKEMAKKNEVRAFQDRGNLRFRAQEIDELARSRGLGSDPALPLGDASKSPAPRRKSKIPTQEPIAFVEDDEAPIGKEPASSFGKGGPPSSKSKPPSSGKGGPASPVGKGGPASPVSKGASPNKVRKPTQAPSPGPKSPPPKAASDSDVRLVAEGSDLDFQVVPDQPKSSPSASPPPGKSSGRKTRSSKLGKGAPPIIDSSVLMVPQGEDSDVKVSPESGAGESALAGPASGKRPSDSDIRVEDSSRKVGGKGRPKENPITEEIDLDEEERRADAAARTQAGPKGRPKANPLNLPTSSPFELSENDIDVDEPPAKTPRPSKPGDKKADTDSSSDFELTPAGDVDPSPLELSSGETKALKQQADEDDDEVGLGELTGHGAAQSGINLQDPADSGISLEQGGSDEIEFELSLDAGATPKPSPASSADESSSEFELTVDAEGSSPVEEGAEDSSSEFELALDSTGAPEGEEESSSEFELSLDVDDSGEAAAGQPEGDSDSEFELTLDADGGLESSGETDALSGDDDEKDIFETDFEVPALEDEESGSEAVVLEDEDTDLETSDFDLDVDEAGSSDEDAESGSQVVALEEEEEADEGAETEARPRRRSRVVRDGDEEEGELDLEIDPTVEPDEDEEEVAVGAGAAAAAPPARWGPLPALLLLPTALVLFVVGLLTFELAGTMWGYRQPGRTTGFGIVLHPIAKYFDSSLPD